MKINTILASAFLLAAWQLLSGSMRDPNNPPTGKTGAPGETTCAQSGCHSGGSYTGTVSISGIPDTVVPNTSYSVTLTNASNAAKAGFQLTCLDNANAKCGTLTTSGTGSGVSVGNGTASKQYARQASPKTLSNGSASWTFSWKAPATASGNLAKFYFVSLCANGTGSKSGDNVLTGTKQVVLQQVVGTEEEVLAEGIKIFPVPANDVLNIRMPNPQPAGLTLFDANGRQVLSSEIQSFNTLNINELPAGRYTARIQQGKAVVSKSIVKQ